MFSDPAWGIGSLGGRLTSRDCELILTQVRISEIPPVLQRLDLIHLVGVDYDLCEADPGDLDPHAVSSVFKAYIRERTLAVLYREINALYLVTCLQYQSQSSPCLSAQDLMMCFQWATSQVWAVHPLEHRHRNQ